jgi:AdoMet-dependent heme synthase
VDYSQSPFLVIWEVTQACDLACRHCRACAQPQRDPGELTFQEGTALLQEISRFEQPLMVFTGGDPLKRPDLFELLRASVNLGLRTTVTPSATPLLSAQAVERIKQSGVSRMAISLDGCDAVQHDFFRGVEGSFIRSLRALETARQIGLETQINTTVTRHNLEQLPRIADLVEALGARMWSAFFLVTAGRASQDDDLTAEEYEKVFALLFQLSREKPFDIKTTEAQHYRRFVAQNKKAERVGASGVSAPPSLIRRQAGINDGKGFVFISHSGDIYPSGFLPIPAGNVRHDSLGEVYRKSPLFLALRDPNRLEGKCGICEFRHLCGGSRSRAFALTRNCFASDPRCVYQPRQSLMVSGASSTLESKLSSP